MYTQPSTPLKTSHNDPTVDWLSEEAGYLRAIALRLERLAGTMANHARNLENSATAWDAVCHMGYALEEMVDFRPDIPGFMHRLNRLQEQRFTAAQAEREGKR